jgi:beta-phosphoglucomutase-like phosphatase (HAD superfamily)
VVATLFDFNGVLVDDEHVHLAAFRDVLRPLGVDVTDEAYASRYLGFDDVGAFRAILTDAGRPPTDAEVRALVDAKKPAYMARIVSMLTIFDGAAEIVRRRASLGTVGIVSGALDHEIRFCLDRMGVMDRVAFIVSAEMCAQCKPDPEGYLQAIAKLGGAREGVVVIEDSLAGIQSAKAAGLRCAAVAHSYAASELSSAGADVVVSRLGDLTDAMLDGARA